MYNNFARCLDSTPDRLLKKLMTKELLEMDETHGFQKLSLKDSDLKQQRVDLFGQFRRQPVFLFILRTQLHNQALQLPVLCNGVTSASLFRIEFHLQLTHLYR